MATRKTLKHLVEQHAANVERINADVEIARIRSERDLLKSRYKAALSQLDAERARADALAGLSGLGMKRHKPSKKAGGAKHRATMIVLLSDWHVEEQVDPATCNFLNSFDLEVCDRRIAELTERFVTLLEHERRLADVSRVLVWLGGDFISGHIHEDTAEMAQLAPLAALRWAGKRIAGFIDTVAQLADSVVVATNSGNHGRSTPKLRVGTELEHSFEQHLYLSLASAEQRPNVDWHVGTGYLNYVDLDGFRVRLHHGHAYTYAGGIGGIHVPVSKANAAWNAVEPANLTCFGHWHQFSWLRAGRYVSNGSLIGHSAYATRIKASFEPPCQACVIVDHRRQEVTKAMPIFCDRDLQRDSKCNPPNPTGSKTTTSSRQNFVQGNSLERTLAPRGSSPQTSSDCSSSSSSSKEILQKCKKRLTKSTPKSTPPSNRKPARRLP